ncbi:MAG: hypothetical protein RBT05_03540 [Bacteroidales bacterium]|jgi:hypothetical protein|nr:hypothetical protein [Bacteroidales bacterium]
MRNIEPTKVTTDKSIEYYLQAIRNADKKIKKEEQRTKDYRKIVEIKKLEDIIKSAKQYPYRKIVRSSVDDTERMYLYNIEGNVYVDAVYVRNGKIDNNNFYLPYLEDRAVIITKKEFEKEFNTVARKLKKLCRL